MKRSFFRRIHDRWTDFSCSFVSKHGRFHLYQHKPTREFFILYHKGESPEIPGLTIECNFLTPGAARKAIPSCVAWESMMETANIRAAVTAAAKRTSERTSP